MEQGAEEVCVDVEYCVILNNANEDAGGRLDTAGSAGENLQGADDHLGGVDPLKPPNEVENMNTTSVMILIDGKLAEGAAAGDFIIGGRGGKEKRKKLAASSAKKPPKPPHRSSGGGDATDHHQLIINKELAELAMIKRARIERMKELLMQKNSANSSKNSSSSSSSSLFAMLFTILVFLVLLFQGMSSCQISCGTFRGTTDEANESGFIFIQEELNPSAAHHSV